MGRRQGQARLGRRHGPVHRRGLRDGDLSVVRRQRLQGDRRDGPVAVHRPDRVGRLRAGLRVQDDDRGGRADEGHRDPVDPDQGRRHAPARQGPDQDRRRRPQGDGLDDVRGRRRLLAQRGRRQGRARARQVDQGIVGDPVRHVDAARLRPADRDRRRGRGRRARPRPGHHRLAPDRPRQRRVRTGRGGDADPARDGLRGPGQRRDARPAARRQVGRRPRGRDRAARRGGRRHDRVGHARPDDEARHHRGPVLPRPDARPRLRRRWQDGHRPDLGSEGQRRPRRLEAQPLQLLVRRMDRARDEQARPRRRHPDRGGDPDGRQGRPHRDAGHVVRALPPDRDRRDHDARPAPRASDDLSRPKDR